MKNKPIENRKMNLQIMKCKDDGDIIISQTNQIIGHYENINAEWWVFTNDFSQLDDLIDDIKFIKKEAMAVSNARKIK